MKPREAAAFLGRLNVLLSTSYTSVGRAATQPLVDGASNRHEGRGWQHKQQHKWTHSMSHMLAFFEELFAHLPPLVFNFRQKSRPKVVIYTDASFSESRNGMGFLLFDEETQQRFVCDAPCPSWLMTVWDDPSCNPWLLSGWANPWKKRKTHINALELLAIVAAVWTVGKQFLQGRQVVFFCDNTSAMSAAVHGYARSPDMAALSNTLHLALAALKCTPFFEWVPSLANCADIPSRPQGPAENDFYEQVKAKHWPGKMKFPSFEKFQRPTLNAIFEQVNFFFF